MFAPSDSSTTHAWVKSGTDFPQYARDPRVVWTQSNSSGVKITDIFDAEDIHPAEM